MKNNPKVSILIPTYNREEVILETLNSAMGQTYKNLEIIVVDNMSTDSTYEILTEIAKENTSVSVYQNKSNIGPVKNWRKCLDYASGEYAKILWSDDLIAPNFIEKTLPFLIENKNVGFVFTGAEVFSETVKTDFYFIGNTGLYDSNQYILSSLLGEPFSVPVSPGNALFRTKDIKKNLLVDIPNKIDSDFSMHAIGNDALIYLLTAKDYEKFAFVNEKLAYFRSHAQSITVDTDKQKLRALYDIAKAYFLENHYYDKKIIKKFNARIFGFHLKNLRSKVLIRDIKSYYLLNTNYSIDLVFFFRRFFMKFKHKCQAKLY